MKAKTWFRIVSRIKKRAEEGGGRCTRIYSNKRKGYYKTKFYLCENPDAFTAAINETNLGARIGFDKVPDYRWPRLINIYLRSPKIKG